jgi:hypothetical protein
MPQPYETYEATEQSWYDRIQDQLEELTGQNLDDSPLDWYTRIEVLLSALTSKVQSLQAGGVLPPLEFIQAEEITYREFTHNFGVNPSAVTVYTLDTGEIVRTFVKIVIPGQVIAVETSIALAYRVLIRP